MQNKEEIASVFQGTSCAFLCIFQNSLHKQVEEMERDSLVTLNVERLKGTHGRITVAWEAAGSTSDVFPTSGVVCDLQNYRRHL